MYSIVTKLVKSEKLLWWEWPKLLGGISAIVLLAALIVRANVSVFIVSICLHVVLDFTLQSDWVNANKHNGGEALVIHSIIAGGIPGSIVGLMTGGPVGSLIGTVVGIASHYIIDSTNKFGIADWRPAICADQLAHFVVLLLI